MNPYWLLFDELIRGMRISTTEFGRKVGLPNFSTTMYQLKVNPKKIIKPEDLGTK